MTDNEMDDRDADRLELLDRIEKRAPEINLDKYELSWETLEDGHEALFVGGGEYFANHGEDLHAYGSLAPIIDGYIGCIVIKPDGSRTSLARCPTRWRSRSRRGILSGRCHGRTWRSFAP